MKVWVRRNVETGEVVYISSSRDDARKVANRFGKRSTTKPKRMQITVS